MQILSLEHIDEAGPGAQRLKGLRHRFVSFGAVQAAVEIAPPQTVAALLARLGAGAGRQASTLLQCFARWVRHRLRATAIGLRLLRRKESCDLAKFHRRRRKHRSEMEARVNFRRRGRRQVARLAASMERFHPLERLAALSSS